MLMPGVLAVLKNVALSNTSADSSDRSSRISATCSFLGASGPVEPACRRTRLFERRR
jgi:hypothetical protein